MKFTSGYWKMRPGYTPYYPALVRGHKVDETGVLVFAPTKMIRHRGDTLDSPSFTIKFSSPMENVFRVQIFHFMGQRRVLPEFEWLVDEWERIQVKESEDQLIMASGELEVILHKKEWRMDYSGGGKPLTNSGWRGLGYVDTPQGRFIHEQLSLGVGECVYGLGERFTPFVKNGQVVDIWNEDGGTSSEIAYKNIPFYMTNRGYGVLVNHPEMVSFEVGSEKVERVQFSVPGESLDYCIIYGPTPKDILQRYTRLTGRPAMPPPWSFGLWLSTSFTTNYDEETVTGFIQGMEDRDIPLHVFHFDCFWMKEFQWVNFTWDPDVFPDPSGMLHRLKARGLHICLWINPYIAQRSYLFDEGKRAGYLLKKPNGDVWQTDQWQSGMGLVDFTNPKACQWYADKLSELIDMGVDCFKTDFGERIPTDVAYFDGSDPQKMHNYYTLLYNSVVFKLLEEKKGKGKAVVFARSATVGGQQFPVHWGGDCTATFESMAESLRGGLSLGLSGFGFWSHDIGGFEQTASADVYKRWCAFGLLSSHSRLHGNSSYRVPWLYEEAGEKPGETAVDVLRFFTHLKCSLMPYLYQTALQAHHHGTPVMRAMVLEFPNDPGCDLLDRQYMLGDSIMVAPVLSHEGSVSYYVPEGRWTHYLSGEVREGPRWYQDRFGFLSLPLLVRPGTILPIGSSQDRVDYVFADGVTLNLYELPFEKLVQNEVPGPGGQESTIFVARRGEKRIRVARSRAPLARYCWNICLIGLHRINTNAPWKDTETGALVELSAGIDEVIIEILE